MQISCLLFVLILKRLNWNVSKINQLDDLLLINFVVLKLRETLNVFLVHFLHFLQVKWIKLRTLLRFRNHSFLFRWRFRSNRTWRIIPRRFNSFQIKMCFRFSNSLNSSQSNFRRIKYFLWFNPGRWSRTFNPPASFFRRTRPGNRRFIQTYFLILLRCRHIRIEILEFFDLNAVFNAFFRSHRVALFL